MKHITIFGSPPILRDISRQYAERYDDVTVVEDAEDINIRTCEELVMLPQDGDDRVTLDLLSRLAKDRLAKDRLANEQEAARRPVVHLMLKSPTTLWLLQTMDFPPEVKEAFEVYPFTMEDVWAKNLLVHLPGISDSTYPRLDRVPIGADSRQRVHVVISGFDKQAEAVAIHAALVAHFPNYHGRDEQPLRTRITVVDTDKARRDDFIAMYQHLFAHSFYRFVDVRNKQTELHRPMYYGTEREDFVDVEWEFVDASVHDELIRERLTRWAQDESRQLTVVVSHASDETNLSQCVSLPSAIYERQIPVFVRQSRSGLAESMKDTYTYKNVYPFGMLDTGYDVNLPLVELAKMVNYFYVFSYMHEHGEDHMQEPPTVIPPADVEATWRAEKSYKNRVSSICNVMTISSKLHSLGHETDSAEKFYALTAEETDSLAETEHNRWNVERLILGVRPCTDAEKEAIRSNIHALIAAPEAERGKMEDLKNIYKKQRNVHFDLCAFDELELDKTNKNVQIYDKALTACIPLIAKTYADETHGRE